jgi:hypothetical protein
MSPASRAIWLRDDADDVMSRLVKCLKRWNSELRGAEENDT